MKNRIALEFQDYADKVMPANAHPTQRKETKRAFYSGVKAMQTIVFRDLSEGEEIEQEDINLLLEIDKELADFAEGVSKGLE